MTETILQKEENEEIIAEGSMEKKPKARLDYLDIAKGIAILLVAIGHVALAFDVPFYRVVIYTFHMPLFFIVSGAVTKSHSRFEKYDRKNFREFVKKNFFALVVPYWIWALVYMQFDIMKIPYILYGTRWSLNEAGTDTVLWFLPCLFSARIIVELLFWLSTKVKMHEKVFAAIAAVVMFALALILPVPEMQLPFGLSQAPMAAGFILLGYAFKDLIAAFHKKGVLLHLLVLAVSTAAFVIGVIVIEGQELVAMFVCDYGNPVRFFCNAISGCIMAMALASLIAKIPEKTFGGSFRRVLSWIGRSTMGIYLTHVPITRYFIAPLFESTFGLARMSLAGGVISGIAGLAISCALMTVIDRFLPQLFGKKLGEVYR